MIMTLCIECIETFFEMYSKVVVWDWISRVSPVEIDLSEEQSDPVLHWFLPILVRWGVLIFPNQTHSTPQSIFSLLFKGFVSPPTPKNFPHLPNPAWAFILLTYHLILSNPQPPKHFPLPLYTRVLKISKKSLMNFREKLIHDFVVVRKNAVEKVHLGLC